MKRDTGRSGTFNDSNVAKFLRPTLRTSALN